MWLHQKTSSVCVKQALNTRLWLVNALVTWHVSYKITTLHSILYSLPRYYLNDLNLNDRPSYWPPNYVYGLTDNSFTRSYIFHSVKNMLFWASLKERKQMLTIINLQTSTVVFQPSQNVIVRPWVYMNFIMHYFFSYIIGLFFVFSFKVYRDILKYIGILDLVRVGQYWQKPLC